MNDISIGILVAILVVLILLSAFFSGSETALMTINRHRLKSLAHQGHRGARLAQKLLKRPDRLLGLILIGNNIVNFMAATLVTIIALKLYGDIGVAIAPFVLTFIVLIFAEVTPKTMAAIRPEKLAYISSYVYTLLMKPLYPLVWFINSIANRLLALVGIHPEKENKENLSPDELRSIVIEASQHIPGKHSDMLLQILDLENASVEDIMIPRNEITGIDLNDDWSDIVHQITHSQRTRIPVFHDSIDNTIGMIHLRKVLNLFSRDELNMDTLNNLITNAYFIPAGTHLTQQLLNFQDKHRRSGLVVDEYGSIQGLVTLEDILEEIVGEFTTKPSARNTGIHKHDDGYYVIDCSTHIRDINRVLDLSLPTDGPKTLNGLLLEHLEMIPDPGTSVLIDGCPIEITRTSKSAIQTAKIVDSAINSRDDETAMEDNDNG